VKRIVPAESGRPQERLGSYVGWRTWRLHLYRNRRRGIREPYLISPLRGDRWDGPVMYAPCSGAARTSYFGFGAGGPPPEPRRRHDFTCECGIYALRRPADCVAAIRLAYGVERPLVWLREPLRRLFGVARGLKAGQVVGSVDLWGRVIVADEGYRAEYAQPRVLYVPEGERWAHPLAARYECRVVEVPPERWGTFAMIQELADEDRWLSRLDAWRIHDGRPGVPDALDVELRHLLTRGQK
jgi:hypothetical protein